MVKFKLTKRKKTNIETSDNSDTTTATKWLYSFTATGSDDDEAAACSLALLSSSELPWLSMTDEVELSVITHQTSLSEVE